MDELPRVAVWRDALFEATAQLGTRVAAFLPSLVGAVLIVLLGWLVAYALEQSARRLLRALGLDRAAARLRLTDVLQRADLPLSLSEVVAKALFWIVMLSSLLFAVQTLGIDAVTATVDHLVHFIPELLGAALIVFLGLIFSRVIETVVTSGAAAAGFARTARVGFVVRLLFVGLVVIVAAEQLGVATSILVGPLTAVLAAAGVAAGLAFALGAYPIVTHILAGHFLKQSLPRNSFVEVDGRRGIVERVGAIDTLFRNGEELWSIPNAKLLDLVVER
jgi:hypothetical protein